MLEVRKKLEGAGGPKEMRPSGFEPEVIPGESKQPQGKPRKEK